MRANGGTAHRAAIALLILAACAVFIPPSSPERFGTNERVRYALTKALVEDGSLEIGRFYGEGIDAALYEGRFYSGKAPAASLLAVPVHALARRAAGPLSDRAGLFLVTLSVITIPAVVLVLLLHGLLLRTGCPDRDADLLVLGYGLGTIAYPYSTLFLGHQLAAVLLFASFLAILRWRRGCDAASARPPLAPSLLAGAGLLGGLAVAAEYQAAVILAIIVCALLPLRRPAAVALFALGCVPGLILVLWYNRACFGHVLSFPYAHEAMPIAREVQGRGLFGVQAPRLVPLAKLLFSPWRGIFFSSPFLLLSLPGLGALWARDDDAGLFRKAVGAGPRRLCAVCLLVMAGYLLLVSSYGAWSGGAAYGPRFLLPALPFFVVPAAALMAERGRGAGLLLGALVACSIALHLVGTAAGPLAHEYLRNPLMEFLIPSFARGNARPNLFLLAGAGRGESLGLIAAMVGAGCAVVLLTGRRRPPPVPSAPRPGRRSLVACAAAAAGMALLLLFHRTDDGAYRSAVLGHSYDVAGDEEAAAAWFVESLRVEPADPLVLRDLSVILLRRGEYGPAADIHVRALAARPDDPVLGRRAEAFLHLLSLTERIERDAGDAGALLERAALLDLLGSREAAERDRAAARGGAE
ncbi:MAG: hypothetical protein PHN82_08645 [bacterium]|nr:hypothetical protein [bacterium]